MVAVGAASSKEIGVLARTKMPLADPIDSLGRWSSSRCSLRVPPSSKEGRSISNCRCGGGEQAMCVQTDSLAIAVQTLSLKGGGRGRGVLPDRAQGAGIPARAGCRKVLPFRRGLSSEVVHSCLANVWEYGDRKAGLRCGVVGTCGTGLCQRRGRRGVWLMNGIGLRKLVRSGKRRSLVCRASDSESPSPPDDSASNNGSPANPPAAPGNPSAASEQKINFKSRREMLLEYVKTVQPEFMDRFIKHAPEQVVDAMRQTVTNMLGTLPPQFFEVTVSTVGENLAQLMYSVMMTGYMFRNAEYRMELQQSLAMTALPDPDRGSRLRGLQYEPGVQKSNVKGEVLRWHKTDGLESMDVVEYIELLESEIDELAKQVEESKKATDGKNSLLEYLKSLQPQNFKDLTSSAGEDALEAMNAFIQRLLGVSDPTTLKTTVSETTASELGKLLYWLMVVGYSIRNIEVRFDMERVLGMPVSPLAELPPGEF
ncbi:hypothetical protein CBR_g12699 [Chara braunii]|uniref:Uncharacterized protein n=1 Tax=Chara braunii TaxID=69332 RepID=A0A388KSD9_CHABU|nr:hypothetical protein CBR_g12699 [Chara braunii]|eukprot:GBG72981.1 hypothetical protein CBR_g12699 [Chara braunii]